MVENFSNLIFIAVALAVFIGRSVVQAKKRQKEEEEEKKNPKPKPKPQVQGQRPKVHTLHFEEDGEDDYVPGYLKKPAPAPKPVPAKVTKKPQTPARTPLPSRSVPTPPQVDRAFPIVPTISSVRPIMPIGALSSGEEGFNLNLNHLSPMQQAVIMSEILGQPKGLTS